MPLLLVLAASAASASDGQAPAGIDMFFRQLVAYEASNGGTKGPAFLDLFAPILRAAIDADTKGPGVGTLDYDPICDCQDNEGLEMKLVSVTGNNSVADMTIGNALGANHRRVLLHVINGPAGWKIADIATKDRPSLLRTLEEGSRSR